MSTLQVHNLQGLPTFNNEINIVSGTTLNLSGGAMKFPNWQTAGRPTSPDNGTLGINTENNVIDYYSSSAGWTEIGAGGQVNIIDRGDPANGNDILLLEDFNTVHFYYSANTSVYITTGLVQNAVYEMTYTSSGGAANIDFYIYPNGTTYSGEFRSHYRATDGSANFTRADQTLNHFYFDHFFGGSGTDPMGKIWFTTGPADKYMYYLGSDTASLSVGYCRWTNNTRSWDWVGYNAFNGDNKRFWVRRIA